MPVSLGDHIGGVRTTDDLLARSTVDDITGCWHWKLAMFDGAARVHLRLPDTGVLTIMRGPRAAVTLAEGTAPPKGHTAWLKCESHDCVNPAHAVSGSRQQWGQWLTKTGTQRGNPNRVLASRRTARSKLAKIDLDTAREIRASHEPTTTLAERYSLSTNSIWEIRSGRRWRDELPGASVFGLAVTLSARRG